MRIVFRGWKRELMEHHHNVVPVSKSNNTYKPSSDERSLTWTSSLQALGKVDNLALNGSFLIEFNFEEEELRNWLREFVRSNPESAVRLLAEMQAETILTLAGMTEKRIFGGNLDETG
jgi:hypothetical protein